MWRELRLWEKVLRGCFSYLLLTRRLLGLGNFCCFLLYGGGNGIGGEIGLERFSKASALDGRVTSLFRSPGLELETDFLSIKLQVSGELAPLLGDEAGDEVRPAGLGQLDDLLARDGALEDGLAGAELARFSAPIDWSQI